MVPPTVSSDINCWLPVAVTVAVPAIDAVPVNGPVIFVPLKYMFKVPPDVLAVAATFTDWLTVAVLGSLDNVAVGNKKGVVKRILLEPAVNTGTSRSASPAFRCTSVPVASLKSMATFKIVSPAGTPPAAELKYALGLVMVKDHLLLPSDVAVGAVVDPHVVGT